MPVVGNVRRVVQGSIQFWRERSRSEHWVVAAAFVALFAAYAPLIGDVIQNGDAAVYNEQIERHVFGEHLIHVGYIAIGSVFHAVLPFTIDRALNIMALTLGIAGAGALYATGKLWGSRLAGVSSVLLLLCSSAYVRSMVLSEVDILSASLVTIAYACYARDKSIVAGMAFGLGMLSTPITLGMLPLFVFTFPIDDEGAVSTVRRQVARVFWFGLAGLVVYAPWVLWHFHAYFYGNRGILTAPRARFNVAQQVAHGVDFFERNAWGLLPLYLASLLSALTDRQRWRRDQPALGIVLSVIATALLFDRTTDVPVHLANLCMLSLSIALLLERFASASRIVWALPVCAFALMGIPSYLAARDEVKSDERSRQTYVEMRNQSLPLQAMLVDLPRGFTNYRAFEHYMYGRSYTGRAPTLVEFRRQLSELDSGPDEYAIYFARRGVPPDIELALARRYAVGARVFNGQRYAALLPRSVGR
jgi:hypothetical protein